MPSGVVNVIIVIVAIIGVVGGAKWSGIVVEIGPGLSLVSTRFKLWRWPRTKVVLGRTIFSVEIIYGL
jgi:hypothetical protein